MAWDGCIRYPAPFHLAVHMDRNHPKFRRSADLELEELEELGGDEG